MSRTWRTILNSWADPTGFLGSTTSNWPQFFRHNVAINEHNGQTCRDRCACHRPRHFAGFRSNARMCPRHLSGLFMMSGSFRDFVKGRTPEDPVDGRGGPGRDDFGVPRESLTLGDGKYKLEIGMRQAGCFPSGDLRQGRCQRAH